MFWQGDIKAKSVIACLPTPFSPDCKVNKAVSTGFFFLQHVLCAVYRLSSAHPASNFTLLEFVSKKKKSSCDVHVWTAAVGKHPEQIGEDVCEDKAFKKNRFHILWQSGVSEVVTSTYWGLNENLRPYIYPLRTEKLLIALFRDFNLQ